MTGSAARTRRRERGAALLTAMVGIAVLTALAVDLAYESRVSLRIAANARDELRASYLARSGVAMSRLVLSFQQSLDDTSTVAAAVPVPRLQIWRMVPVGSQMVEALFPGSAPAPPSAEAESESESAGATRPRPGFDAVIDDEARKVNMQLEGFVGTSDRKLWSKVQALYHLVCDPRWDPLFEREDERGVRISREELLVYLRDWVDENEQSSGLVPIAGGAHCAMVANPAKPFEDAFGDENQPYDRGDDRYRAKNHRMDSLDELHLVAGVGDAFMAAFGDALTVYPERDAKRNVNELDAQGLRDLVFVVADPVSQTALLDPLFWERLQALVVQQTLGGILAIKPSELGQLIREAGVTVNANLLHDQNGPFTDRSTTFRIRSKGTAGDVTAAIDAVVRLVKTQAGEPVAAPGKLIHWREE